EKLLEQRISFASSETIESKHCTDNLSRSSLSGSDLGLSETHRAGIISNIEKNSVKLDSTSYVDSTKESELIIQRPSLEPLISRERSLESLESLKIKDKCTSELIKGVSEPVLNSEKCIKGVLCSRGDLKKKEDMTVTHSSTSVLLAKHWGPQRLVQISREPKCSLGISIVGGKVDLYNSGPDSASAISGIFIKNVLPQSPAGRTGELKVT
ncbi:hypothetical protein AAG570_012858, partial [Ranatra chinensis]